MAPGCGVSNGVSGIPGDLPEYATLPSHAGLCEDGPTLSLAARGTKMEKVYEKKIDAKDVEVKERRMKKEITDLEKPESQEEFPKTLFKDDADSVDASYQLKTEESISKATSSDLKIDDNNQKSSGSPGTEQKKSEVDEVEAEDAHKKAVNSSLRSEKQIQNVDLSEERLTSDVAEPKTDGESDKQSLKLLQIEEIIPKAAVASSKENNYLEVSGSVKEVQKKSEADELLKVDDVCREAANSCLRSEDKDQNCGSSEERLITDVTKPHKDGESNGQSLKLWQTEEIIPKAAVASLEEDNNLKMSDPLKIEQTTSEASSFLKDVGIPNQAAISSLRSEKKIQNVDLSEERLIPDFAEPKIDGESDKQSLKLLQTEEILAKAAIASSEEDNNLKMSDLLKIEQTTSEAATLSLDRDKTLEASGSREIEQKTSRTKEVVKEDGHNENYSSLRNRDKMIKNSNLLEISSSLETGTTSKTLATSMNRNDLIKNYSPSGKNLASDFVESINDGGSNKQILCPIITKTTSKTIRLSSKDVDNTIINSRPSKTGLDSSESIESPRKSDSALGNSSLDLTIPKALATETPLKVVGKILKKDRALDMNKNQTKSVTEKQNVLAVERKKPVKLSRNQRRKAKRQALLKFGDEGQGKAGNLPEKAANVSVNIGSSTKGGIDLTRNQGNSSGNQAHQAGSKTALVSNQRIVPKQEVLPSNQGIPKGYRDISGKIKATKPGNQKPLSRNEGSQQSMQVHPAEQLPKIEENSSLSQRNVSAIPSTSTSEIPQNSFENSSGKRKRESKDSSSQDSKRCRISERDSDTFMNLTRIIIPDGYRRRGISKVEMTQVQNAISQEIDRISGGYAPRFNNSYLKLGGIVVESADEWSRDWLTERVPHLRPWSEARLRVVDSSNLEKFHRIVIKIPGPIENSETILKRLKNQNPTLKTDVWRIHSGEEEFTPRGFNLIFGIPDSSVKALRKMDFKPFLGLTRVTACVIRTEYPGEGQGFSSWR